MLTCISEQSVSGQLRADDSGNHSSNVQANLELHGAMIEVAERGNGCQHILRKWGSREPKSENLVSY
jgi:hypothetical protein